MATLTIRNLNDEVKRKLRVRAASHGRSMEAEARLLLSQVLAAGMPKEEESGTARIHGRWKGKFTTDEILGMTRGED
jgi:plasmid stability protein